MDYLNQLINNDISLEDLNLDKIKYISEFYNNPNNFKKEDSNNFKKEDFNNSKIIKVDEKK